jgi:hypothetical protein
MTMTQSLIVIAALPFLLFGVGHGAITLRDLRHPRAFTPPDVTLRQAMQQSSIRFRGDINLWRAWLGFNLTHSLGLIVFGSVFLYVGIFEPGTFTSSLPVQLFALVVSAAYFATSIKYFFVHPVIGSAIGMVCFLAAAGLAHT